MLSKYLEALKSVINQQSQMDKSTFGMYLEAIKYSFIIVLMALGFLLLLAILIGFPILGYKFFVVRVGDKWCECCDELSKLIEKAKESNPRITSWDKTEWPDELHEVYKKKEKLYKQEIINRVLYIATLIFVYLPIAIPTLLLLSDLYMR